MLGPGDVLGDRYRLDEFVASGGMGQVFRATDKTLGRTVAVKVLLPGLTRNSEFGSRFRSEARIMASIGHAGVVGVYDYGETPEGTLFLVMAFVNGRPLGERITQQGTLSVEETMAIVAQAADALQAAHSNGIIHRDVKPNNLLVADDGAVTLVDFGVARSEAVTSVTKVSAVIGTALYMSPEQASGKPISPSTDIYALGAVAYHCLTGAPPFTGNSPLEIAIKHLQDEPPPLPANLPADARALVERAMEKDPSLRFPSAAAMAAAARGTLSPTLQDDATVPLVRTASPGVTSRPDPSDEEPSGRPAWVPIVLGLAILALVGGVVLAVVALTRGAIDNDTPGAGASNSASVSPSASAKAPAATPTKPVASASSIPATSAPPSVVPSSSAPPTPPASSAPPATTAAPPPTPTTEAPPASDKASEVP